MPKNTVGQNVEITIESAPQLWELQFQREVAPRREEEPFPIELGLGLTRFGEDVFGIELTVSSAKDGSSTFLKVTYRAIFRIHIPSPAAVADYEEAVRRVLLYTGPSVIYPYVRETVSSLFQKSGLQGLTLPLVNFHQIVDPNKIEIPPPPPPSTAPEK